MVSVIHEANSGLMVELRLSTRLIFAPPHEKIPVTFTVLKYIYIYDSQYDKFCDICQSNIVCILTSYWTAPKLAMLQPVLATDI